MLSKLPFRLPASPDQPSDHPSPEVAARPRARINPGRLRLAMVAALGGLMMACAAGPGFVDRYDPELGVAMPHPRSAVEEAALDRMESTLLRFGYMPVPASQPREARYRLSLRIDQPSPVSTECSIRLLDSGRMVAEGYARRAIPDQPGGFDWAAREVFDDAHSEFQFRLTRAPAPGGYAPAPGHGHGHGGGYGQGPGHGHGGGYGPGYGY